MPDPTSYLPEPLRESFEADLPVTPEALPTLTAADADAAPPRAEIEAIAAAAFPDAVTAGLLLIAGADDASHAVSQRNEGEPDCDYWHAIMHRREPDYGNAGYWFRRVGRHSAMQGLPSLAASVAADFGVQPQAAPLLEEPWDAGAMIDLCRIAEGSPGSPLHTFCRAVQWAEMRSHLRHCLIGD